MSSGRYGTSMQAHGRKAAGVTKKMPKYLVKKNNKRRRILREIERIRTKIASHGFDAAPRLRKYGEAAS